MTASSRPTTDATAVSPWALMRQRSAAHGLGVLAPGESSRRAGLATLGLVMFVVFSVKYDNFLSTANMTTIALNVSSLAIAAVGTMALLVSGHVDLSIGSQYAFVAVVTATVVRETSNPVLGVATALALGLVLGLLNGILVVWLKISPLIVTLGMLAIYRGLAFLAGGGVSVYGFPSSFAAIGRTRWFGVPLPVVVAALVFLVGGWVLVVTVSGLRLFAIGGNRESARLVGLNVNRIVVTTFGINGALIGLVAALATAKLGSGAPNLGIQFEMAVLTAVILGGVAFNGGSGHPLGVIIGVCTIGILDAGLIFAGLQDWWQQISRGSLLVLALICDQLVLAWKQRRSLTGKLTRVPARRAGQYAPAADSGSVQPLTDQPVLLEATGLTVQYSGANVLEDAHLRVRVGEVVCLVGDNGAGKSSLVKAISGVVRLAAGTIELDGRRMELRNPADVRRAGIETVYQDLALCQNLGIAHNLVLGNEPTRRLFGVIPVRDDRAAVDIARSRLQSLGVAVDDFNRPVARLSGGQRQSVAISRVLRDDVRLVILDEPTAALGVTQTAEVLRLVRTVAAAGLGVVLISHDVEDIFEVADRVVILQLGRVIFDGALADLTRLELLRLMAGRGRRLEDELAV